MGAFNLPPFMMSITLLAGTGTAVLACLGAVVWDLLPLPAAIVLTLLFAHTLLTGVVVAVAASKPLERRTLGLFGKASCFQALGRTPGRVGHRCSCCRRRLPPACPRRSCRAAGHLPPAPAGLPALMPAHSLATRSPQRADGGMPWHRWLLLAPFHLSAQLVMAGYRLLSGEALATEVDAGLWLSGCPSHRRDLPLHDPPALLDVTCEMPRTIRSGSAAYRVLPSWETHGWAQGARSGGWACAGAGTSRRRRRRAAPGTPLPALSLRLPRQPASQPAAALPTAPNHCGAGCRPSRWKKACSGRWSSGRRGTLW